jgi:hypothetical protein
MKNNQLIRSGIYTDGADKSTVFEQVKDHHPINDLYSSFAGFLREDLFLVLSTVV